MAKRTLNAKEEIGMLARKNYKKPTTPNYSSDFIKTMSELNQVTDEYVSMLKYAQQKHSSLSRVDGARERLKALSKKLDELSAPILKLDDDAEQHAANIRMTAIYNAVHSSLNSLSKFS